MNVVRFLRLSCLRLVKPSKLLCRGHCHTDARILGHFITELVPIHQKLVTIRRQLVALGAKEGPQKAELKPLQEELRRIDSLSTSPVLPCLLPLFVFGAWPPCYTVR